MLNPTIYIDISSSSEEDLGPDSPPRQEPDVIQTASQSLISTDVSEKDPIPDTLSPQEPEVMTASKILMSISVSPDVQSLELSKRLDITAVDLMEKGSIEFKDHHYEKAANNFKIARDILIKNHGEFALECVPAYYKYGLALMYKVPIPFDKDPMSIVPKEADYYSVSAGKAVVKDDGPGINMGDVNDTLESAWKELNIAWSIVKEQPGNTMEKVNILSALGEVAYRKGELNPHHYYHEALRILNHLVESDNQRIAHLNFKLSLCLKDSSKTAGAIIHCKKAISVCRTRLKRLIAETTSSSKTAATLTIPNMNLEPPTEPDEDLSIVQKKAERRTLIKLTSDLLLKLDEL